MRQHPRESTAAKAEAEMTTAIAEIVEKHDLTCGEVLVALTEIQARWANRVVRNERTSST